MSSIELNVRPDGKGDENQDVPSADQYESNTKISDTAQSYTIES